MTETRVIITLPHLGEDVIEATISRWLVAVGDHVDADDPLLEVATDKVDTEVPSTHSGILVEILAAEDEIIAVDAPLAVMALAGEPDEPTAASVEEAAPSTAQRAQNDPSPRPGANSVVGSEKAATTVERLPRIRQVIARRMLESLRTSAQLTTVVEADVTEIGHLRAAIKDQFHRDTGAKLSYLPIFAKATVEALVEHPILGASVNADCTEITLHRDVHLGIAVDSPKGLMVPVVRDAQNMGVAEIAVAIAELAEQVRAATISPDSLNGGTFTITNTGSRGALFDTPILNQPQSGILGTGAVVERVLPRRDAHGALGFGIRAMVYLAITYDHRVVDGADAARFLNTIKARLEAGFTADEVLSQDNSTPDAFSTS